MPHEKLGYELYNLARDPGEESNVFDGNPEIAKRLEKKITQIVCRGRTTKGRPQSNDTGYWDDLAWLTEAEYNKSVTKN
jgi:arylsulfatase A